MALIKCSECGKEISDKASSCIHCGNTLRKKINISFKQLMIIVLIVLTILATLLLVPNWNQSSNKISGKYVYSNKEYITFYDNGDCDYRDYYNCKYNINGNQIRIQYTYYSGREVTDSTTFTIIDNETISTETIDLFASDYRNNTVEKVFHKQK